MFIRKVKSGKNTYLQVVESKRIQGKSVHKVLFSLGKVDENNQLMNKQFLSDLADQIKIACQELSKDELHSLKDINVGSSVIYNYGYAIYEEMFRQLGLENLLTKIRRQSTRMKIDIVGATVLMMLERFFEPSSKLSAYEHQSRFWHKESVELHQLYRTLDILAENKDSIETQLFKKNHGNKKELHFVLYDVTTYAFESVEVDTLKEFGYSKDKKFNEVQVVMGLAISDEGIPIGYELFSGSTSEIKTMDKIIQNVKEKYKSVERITLVADGGIHSKANLSALKINHIDYVVSMRIKSMSNELKQQMFQMDGYQRFSNSENDFRYKEVRRTRIERGQSIEEKLVFIYSAKRARKDAKDRERLLEKAYTLVENPASIKALHKRGGKKYLKEVGNSTFQIDEAAIERSAQFDGYRGIVTNTTSSAEEILESYHGLWKIEESFRIMKTTLKARPIFHYTEQRIKGHFVLCYINLVIARLLEKRLQGVLSIEEWREAIAKMNVVETTLNGITSVSVTQDDQNMKLLKQLIPLTINNRHRIVVSL